MIYKMKTKKLRRKDVIKLKQGEATEEKNSKEKSKKSKNKILDSLNFPK